MSKIDCVRLWHWQGTLNMEPSRRIKVVLPARKMFQIIYLTKYMADSFPSQSPITNQVNKLRIHRYLEQVKFDRSVFSSNMFLLNLVFSIYFISSIKKYLPMENILVQRCNKFKQLKMNNLRTKCRNNFFLTTE